MKITTTWLFSQRWNYTSWLPHCMAARAFSPSSALDQALQGLPTITQLAQRWPSHRCTQLPFHIFPLPFPPQILFILVVLVFFRMEILRSIGVACSGGECTKGWGWGMGRGLGRETLPSSDVAACRPCVLYFQLEFDHKWSKATTGLHNSQALNAHTRDEHRLPTIDHIHWIPTNIGQKTVLSQTLLPTWTIV